MYYTEYIMSIFNYHVASFYYNKPWHKLTLLPGHCHIPTIYFIQHITLEHMGNIPPKYIYNIKIQPVGFIHHTQLELKEGHDMNIVIETYT